MASDRIKPIEEVLQLAQAVYKDMPLDRISGKEYLDKLADMAARYRGRLFLGPDVPLSTLPILEFHVEKLPDDMAFFCLNGRAFSPQVLEEIAHVCNGGLYFHDARESESGASEDQIYLTIPKVKVDPVIKLLDAYYDEMENAAAYISVNIGESKASYFGVRGTDLPSIIDVLQQISEDSKDFEHVIILALPYNHPADREIKELLARMSHSGDISYREDVCRSDLSNNPIRQYYFISVPGRYANDAQALFGSLMSHVSQSLAEEEESVQA